MTQAGREAACTFNDALAIGGTRAKAFDEALAIWRRWHPEHSELRAVADLATVLHTWTTPSARRGA
jgi:hypothetical protein